MQSDERERINRELRQLAHQELELAKAMLLQRSSSEKLKKVHARLEGIVKDRTQRVKTINLRKLLETIKILKLKTQINELQVGLYNNKQQ